MPKFIKIILGIVVFAIVGFAILSFFSLRLVKRSLPQTKGEIHLANLRSNVTVYRDDYGVPHVFAENEEDLWRAAGYVAAQDRLWQMDFTRRAMRGTLSEIFGAETLPQDKFLRVWGFHRLAKRIAQTLSPQARAALVAYAEGVNAYLNSYRDRLPVEFSMLGYKPQPWEIEDSIGFSRLMAFRLSYSWFFEAALGKVAEKFGAPMALELFPAVLENSPLIVPDWPTTNMSAAFEDFIALAQDTRERLGMPAGVQGSNNWVVHGKRTRRGKPILANDPHLTLTLPSVWYEMHLAAGSLEVSGQTLAGAPGVVLGHNRSLAWGFTNGMVDDLDFYQERLNPDNPKEYWDGQAWQPMEVLSEQILVKDAEPVPFEIRFTAHGPLVNDILKAAQNDTLGLSIRWAGFEPSEESYAILALNRATSWPEFQEAMRHFKVPCQNVVYADTAGNIGYWACGAVPIRRDGKGYLPYRGWEKAGDWVGMIPFEEMPHAFNPPQNFIATANNKMTDEKYPYYISNAWEPASRIERITEMLLEANTIDTTYVKAMQTDVVSKHALYVLPRLLHLLKNDSTSADTAFTLPEKQAMMLLQAWNGEESAESVGAALFNVWELEFLQATLKDEMGDTLFENYTQWSALALRASEYFVEHPLSPWFDDRATEAIETGPQIARRAFRSCLSHLWERFGELMGDWQWGRLHRLTLAHPFGKQPPMDIVFNVGPLALGGSASSVSKAEYSLSQPYDVSAGPSMRMVVDLASPQYRLAVIPGGQSGQPFSPHYKDQVELWRNGKYRRVAMSRQLVAASSSSMLTLKP
ncbi:MAG: penicillin acylase family protein [bacterium]